ncbi:MAG: NrtA/SsuA/CpmA family ABC transporter substrate-binding protein [Betaproteobacteria bacterium]
MTHIRQGIFCARSALARGCLIVVLGLYGGFAQGDDYVERYGLIPGSSTIDVGVQPLGYPSGVISIVMQHDRILRRALSENARPLKMSPFRRGADMLPLLIDQRLEAGLLGDMPTIAAAASGSVWIVGLVKQASTALVASGTTQVKDLAGKRIGYVEASSAHHTLLQGLASAGLQENQIRLIPLRVDEMPAALARGDIEAFAAWEPAPSIALNNSDQNRIVFRGQSADYFVMNRQFVANSPEAARHLAAGLVRAIEWMRRSQKNLARAVLWAMAETESFSGKRETLSPDHVASITRREILNIPSAPTLVISAEAYPLTKEYEFLSKLGKLPSGAEWGKLKEAFAYPGLADVMSAPRKYRISDFDYED